MNFFLNKNCYRKYPIQGNATGVANSGFLLPSSFICAASVSTIITYTDLYVKYITVQKPFVSVTIYANGSNKFVGSAQLNFTSDYSKADLVTNVPYFGGYIVFGLVGSLSSIPNGTYEFSYEATKLEGSCVFVYTPPTLEKIKTESGEVVGNVKFQLDNLVVLDNEGVLDFSVVDTKAITASPAQYDQNSPCITPHILGINDVTPDSAGNINVYGIDPVTIELVKSFNAEIAIQIANLDNFTLCNPNLKNIPPSTDFATGGGAVITPTFTGTGISGYSIEAGGLDYATPPQIIIIGTGSSAAGTAVLSSGEISQVNVVSGGSNYTKAPTAILIGGGCVEPAVLTPVLTGDSVSSVTIDYAGVGYVSPPQILLYGGGGSGAVLEAEVTHGAITGVTVTDLGGGYNPAGPHATFSGDGKYASGYPTVTDGGVDGFVITDVGEGYTTAPTVTIAGGGGSSATATATLGRLWDFNIYNRGAGYTSTPTVTITGGGGTDGDARANIKNGKVDSITILNPGYGYTSTPSVSITGGGGTGAVASAIVRSDVLAKVEITNPGSGYQVDGTIVVVKNNRYNNIKYSVFEGNSEPEKKHWPLPQYRYFNT